MKPNFKYIGCIEAIDPFILEHKSVIMLEFFSNIMMQKDLMNEDDFYKMIGKEFIDVCVNGVPYYTSDEFKEKILK